MTSTRYMLAFWWGEGCGGTYLGPSNKFLKTSRGINTQPYFGVRFWNLYDKMKIINLL